MSGFSLFDCECLVGGERENFEWWICQAKIWLDKRQSLAWSRGKDTDALFVEYGIRLLNAARFGQGWPHGMPSDLFVRAFTYLGEPIGRRCAAATRFVKLVLAVHILAINRRWYPGFANLQLKDLLDDHRHQNTPAARCGRE